MGCKNLAYDVDSHDFRVVQTLCGPKEKGVEGVSDYYPFGMQIQERSWSSTAYRYGFNGKDFFSDWNRQDYGFRIYDPRKCRFESVDPLHRDYSELTPYQFASNSPIAAIDLDGLEAYFLNGTWNGNIGKLGKIDNNETYYWSDKSKNKVANYFGNKTSKNAYWSGHNNQYARKFDAKVIAAQIYLERSKSKKDEPLTLVGHSHGGNVAIEIANILENTYDMHVDFLVTLNTPVRDDHQLDDINKGHVNHVNLYNMYDRVQVNGGYSRMPFGIITGLCSTSDCYDSGSIPGTGESGPAGRQFPNALNIKYDHVLGTIGDPGNHMGVEDANVDNWLEKLENNKVNVIFKPEEKSKKR